MCAQNKEDAYCQIPIDEQVDGAGSYSRFDYASRMHLGKVSRICGRIKGEAEVFQDHHKGCYAPQAFQIR
jgi:hypothetical protein